MTTFKTYCKEQTQKQLEWKDVLRITKNTSDPVFVRWSAGPEIDMKRGAKSRNAATGQMERGLSAQRIDDVPEKYITLLATMIVEYRFSGNPNAHLYHGEIVGEGGDGEPLIRPTEYLGTMSNESIKRINKWHSDVLEWKYEKDREGSAPDLADYVFVPDELKKYSNKVW